MKGKPEGKPSGSHPFDTVCANAKIEHRLTKPFKPQTNGMVERFNRRIAEAIGREKKRGAGHRLFANHADRDAFLNQFVHDYNHTRLKCLAYVAPLEALANLQGPNTFAGTSVGLYARLVNEDEASRLAAHERLATDAPCPAGRLDVSAFFFRCQQSLFYRYTRAGTGAWTGSRDRRSRRAPPPARPPDPAW
jgi:hypothetical protein